MVDDWLEGETELETELGTGVTAETSALVPGLTILAHSDPRRVGERIALPVLSTRHPVRLSRLEPSFRQPHERSDSGSGRPLEDRQLSRRPIKLIAGTESGSVVLDCGTTRTRVTVGDEVVQGSRVFSAAEIDDGVVLRLGKRLVLLLHRLSAAPPRDLPPHFGLVGESRAMLQLRREIRRAAALDVPVLLRGESGTGKELVARAVHDAGPRHAGPFEAVNMGALPPSLAAAELFGAVRGAFTGADRNKEGYFQRADGGTLLLDEIGEAPLEIQVMLLRVLETQRFHPVGGAAERTIDVRVIAATDADLEAAIAGGRFRAPLYHRLAGYDLRLPPLRERRDDVGRLFIFFLEQELARRGGAAPPVDREPRSPPPGRWRARLACHDWPGNVRELRNVTRRLAIHFLDEPSDPAEGLLDGLLGEPTTPMAPETAAAGTRETPAPASTAGASRPDETPKRRRFRKPSEVDERELLEALADHRWELKPTAEALGVSRATLYRLIEGCPAVRKATELSRREIDSALKRNGGDPGAAAIDLQVSVQGLKRRITALSQ